MIDIDVWWIKTKNTHWWWLDHQRTSEFRELRRSVLASGDWREIYIYKYSICVYYNACVLYGNGTFISANGMIYVYWYKNMFIYIYICILKYLHVSTDVYILIYIVVRSISAASSSPIPSLPMRQPSITAARSSPTRLRVPWKSERCGKYLGKTLRERMFFPHRC